MPTATGQTRRSAVQLRQLLATLGLVVAALATTATAHAQALPVDRPAEVVSGTCLSLGDVVVPLAHLVITAGDPQGQLVATPVEQSGTVVEFDVADFLTTDHAIVVRESPADTALLVSCGEVGGAMNPDGTLAIGMRSMNGSGLSGVAYFTPIDQFDKTLVTILLVSDAPAAPAPVEDVSAPVEAATT
jgi:hypothetical protein